jgi:hypothetical protein
MIANTIVRIALGLALLALFNSGCDSSSGGSGTDGDSYSDTDTDSDSDSDSDGDSDSDTDFYVLYAPLQGNTTYLMDSAGNTAHSWACDCGAGNHAGYLLENGNLLRPGQVQNNDFAGGGGGGKIQEIDWDGNVVWEFSYSNSDHYAHHDIEPMPNGNILAIAWEVKTAAEAEQAGRDSNEEVWPDHIIEIEPSGSSNGTIVWEWHAWDHLIQDHDSSKDNYGVVAEHPEKIDVNAGESGPGPGGGDWLHLNGVGYNPELDQIVFSSHFLHEIYVIDHDTTTTEAAGQAGDLLYRWGNPANYDAGNSSAQMFYVVHNGQWIDEGLPGAGNFLAFNNGDGRPTGNWSSADEIASPVNGSGDYGIDALATGEAFGPADLYWTYSDGASFYSNHISSAQRLSTGDTLICEGTSGAFHLVTEDGNEIWSESPSDEVARALLYFADYPGLSEL